MEPTTFRSPAKVNLYLKILGRRPDGFHDIETVMAALSLADAMRFESKPEGVTIECSAPGVPCDESNLAVRAARLIQQRFSATQGVHIAIEKHTPVGGGMGGGSSNAGTTLRALNELWKQNAPQATLEELAATLGSDCAFFLKPSVALCRGRGEIIEPLARETVRGLDGLTVVLVNPGFGVPTSWAYKAYAAGGGAAAAAEPERSVKPLMESLARADVGQIASHLYNSFEEVVFRKYPILEIFKRSLLEAGAAGALMSGSGATVFGLCESVASAEAVQAKIAAKFGDRLWTRVAAFAL